MPFRLNFPGQFPGQMIPDATSANDGVMTAQQANQLAGLSIPTFGITVLTLEDNTNTPFIAVTPTLLTNGRTSFFVNYIIEADDGTVFQILSGSVIANILDSTTTGFGVVSETTLVSGGSLVATFSWGNTASTYYKFRVNANTSLAGGILRITYNVSFALNPSALSIP